VLIHINRKFSSV